MSEPIAWINAEEYYELESQLAAKDAEIEKYRIEFEQTAILFRDRNVVLFKAWEDVKRLRKGLAFYADEKNWVVKNAEQKFEKAANSYGPMITQFQGEDFKTTYEGDGGKVAREFLEGSPR